MLTGWKQPTQCTGCLKNLMKGAHLDISGENVPGLKQMLCTSKSVTLRHVVNVPGPEPNNINAETTLFGQRSTRHSQNIVEMWTSRMINEELALIEF